MVQIHQRVPHADVAQLVERLFRKQRVFGSTPNIGSRWKINRLGAGVAC